MVILLYSFLDVFFSASCLPRGMVPSSLARCSSSTMQANIIAHLAHNKSINNTFVTVFQPISECYVRRTPHLCATEKKILLIGLDMPSQLHEDKGTNAT